MQVESKEPEGKLFLAFWSEHPPMIYVSTRAKVVCENETLAVTKEDNLCPTLSSPFSSSLFCSFQPGLHFIPCLISSHHVWTPPQLLASVCANTPHRLCAGGTEPVFERLLGCGKYTLLLLVFIPVC